MWPQRSAGGEGGTAESQTGSGCLAGESLVTEAQRCLVAEKGVSGLRPRRCAGQGEGGWAGAEARRKAPAHHSEESEFIPKALGVVHLQTLRSLNREPRQCSTQRAGSEGSEKARRAALERGGGGGEVEEEVSGGKPAPGPQLESATGGSQSRPILQNLRPRESFQNGTQVTNTPLVPFISLKDSLYGEGGEGAPIRHGPNAGRPGRRRWPVPDRPHRTANGSESEQGPGGLESSGRSKGRTGSIS